MTTKRDPWVLSLALGLAVLCPLSGNADEATELCRKKALVDGVAKEDMDQLIDLCVREMNSASNEAGLDSLAPPDELRPDEDRLEISSEQTGFEFDSEESSAEFEDAGFGSEFEDEQHGPEFED